MSLRNKILAAAFDALSDFATEVHDLLTDPDKPTHTCGEHATDQYPDSPEVASDLPQQALIAVDGRYVNLPPGRKALRVTEARRQQVPGGMFGQDRDAVTLLVTDLETGRSDSLTVALTAALDVAVEVPDTVPANLDGGAS